MNKDQVHIVHSRAFMDSRIKVLMDPDKYSKMVDMELYNGLTSELIDNKDLPIEKTVTKRPDLMGEEIYSEIIIISRKELERLRRIEDSYEYERFYGRKE